MAFQLDTSRRSVLFGIGLVWGLVSWPSRAFAGRFPDLPIWVAVGHAALYSWPIVGLVGALFGGYRGVLLPLGFMTGQLLYTAPAALTTENALLLWFSIVMNGMLGSSVALPFGAVIGLMRSWSGRTPSSDAAEAAGGVADPGAGGDG